MLIIKKLLKLKEWILQSNQDIFKCIKRDIKKKLSKNLLIQVIHDI